MKWIVEKDLSEFPFETSQARDTARCLTKDQFEKVERNLEQLYPEGISDTEIEDLFRYEPEEVYKLAGLRSFKVTAEDGTIAYVNVDNVEEERELLGCFDAEVLDEYHEDAHVYDYDALVDWVLEHGPNEEIDMGADDEEQQAEVRSRGWGR